PANSFIGKKDVRRQLRRKPDIARLPRHLFVFIAWYRNAKRRISADGNHIFDVCSCVTIPRKSERLKIQQSQKRDTLARGKTEYP
ncbi:MAG: hypothetical protein LBL45_03060, partial [Treponema sp.]|nr:hypothetical protein [Treponema sp.]